MGSSTVADSHSHTAAFFHDFKTCFVVQTSLFLKVKRGQTKAAVRSESFS